MEAVESAYIVLVFVVCLLAAYGIFDLVEQGLRKIGAWYRRRRHPYAGRYSVGRTLP